MADLEPHDGEVWLGEQAQSLTPANDWRRQVMMVPAESQWWADTVSEHLADECSAAVSALGLPSEAMSWQVSRLSSGEKQRLALIRAVALAPSALLLDEPTANLDSEATAAVECWLLNWLKTHPAPVLWVTHDPAQIDRLAGRHLLIEGRRLVDAQ